MKISRRTIRAGGVLVLAAAIGQVMQNGVPLAGGGRSGPPASEAGAAIQPDSIVTLAARAIAPAAQTRAGDPGPGRVLPDLPAMAGDLPPPGRLLADRVGGLERTIAWPRSDHAGLFDDFGRRCAAAVLGLTAQGDELAVDYADSCRPASMVRIGHAGLSVDLRSDASGRLRLTLPNLMGLAEVTAQPEGQPVLTAAAVSMADARPRAIVTSAVADAIDLRLSGASGPVGGQAMLLGSPDGSGDRMAQVLTVAALPAEPALTLGIRVTAATCGRRVAARVDTIAGGGVRASADVGVTMPDCAATGEIVSVPLPWPDTGDRAALTD